MKKELHELIHQIMNIVEPGIIYLSVIREDSAPVYYLHLVMKSDEKLKAEKETSIYDINKNFPQFMIWSSTASHLRSFALNGEFFSINLACYGQIIYQSENVKDSLEDMPQKGSSLIKKAQEIADQDFNEFAVEFNGINYHFKNEDYDRAINELDTLLMKFFHYLVTLHEGEYVEVEYIEIDHMSRLNEDFDELFHKKNETIRNLLSRLEVLHIYGLTDYENVTLHECHSMFELVKVIFKIVHDVTYGIIASWMDMEEKRNPKKEILIADSNFHRPFDIALKEAVNFLQSQFQVHSIFLLNMRQEYSYESQYLNDKKKEQLLFGCTMLLVTEKPVSMSPAELMDLTLKKVGMKVFFIFKTMPGILETIYREDNNFLNRVINRENNVYSVDDRLSDYYDRLPFYEPNIFSSINTIWNNRINRAKYLHELTNSLDQEFESPVASLTMVQDALKQTCLGLLYVFWEFQPSYTSLSYLNHLCSHFSDFPKEILFSNSFSSRRMFYLLTQAQNHLNFDSHNKYNITRKDKAKAHALCGRFIEKAEHIAEKQLSYLKIKAYQRSRPFYLEKNK